MIILLIQFEIYLDLLAWDKIILYICTRSYNNVNPKQSKTMETKIAFSPRGNKVLLRADLKYLLLIFLITRRLIRFQLRLILLWLLPKMSKVLMLEIK